MEQEVAQLHLAQGSVELRGLHIRCWFSASSVSANWPQRLLGSRYSQDPAREVP